MSLRVSALLFLDLLRVFSAVSNLAPRQSGRVLELFSLRAMLVLITPIQALIVRRKLRKPSAFTSLS